MLAQHVVGIHQQISGLAHLHCSAMPGRQRAQLRHPELNDEASAGRKVACSVLEAPDLLVLREQVGDGVEDQEGQPEGPIHPVWDMSPWTTGIRSSPTFSRSRAIIAWDSSMPLTRTPASERGMATRPVPIANSMAAPSPASSDKTSTVGSRTSGENMPSPGVSYCLAASSSQSCCWLIIVPLLHLGTGRLARRPHLCLSDGRKASGPCGVGRLHDRHLVRYPA